MSVRPDRYGYEVTGQAAAPIGRITAFVRWAARTPWPVFTLGMLQADIIGALFVLGFLRFGLPSEDRVQLQDLPAFNLAIFLGYLFVAFTVGAYLTLRLLLPVIRWQRRDSLLGGSDPSVTAVARVRALRMPYYRTMISVSNWCLGSIVFIVASWPVASRSAPVVAVATALGATATAIIGYLQSERVLRPVAVAALRGGIPESFKAPGVIQRQVLTWVLSTGVPILAIVLALVASKFEILTAPAARLNTPILLLAIAALVIGLSGTVLVAMSIADPLRQLRWALGEVQRGNYNAHMQIYDASELGLLQAGFNDMVRDLAERQRLRDLFGRYVGEDVARRALERGTELGGQERDVAVLFVDLVGSTQLASTRPASEVVSLLNEFFRVIVDTVNRHGGFVNKFQGDAALAIFGAPIEHPDASGGALAASRELHDELLEVLGQTEFGIGVSAGRAIAGHIGAQARFEYTVIGDPVNEAARLTELAKLEVGHVLASAIAVSGALDAEALCWDVGEIVELRGRSFPTQLARPLNLAAPRQFPSQVQG
ncbi:adenylate cyclase [Mycolicibacterium madagascariense]|uniref:Adenylate cyclase n=1 Tax=Mycolicibacterium madagascariense TaxID=212765 RepID=A0A7I7XN71_9MYCO|nr:adenylate/guanylate cyclase domain-containing protein [Mycolicibacterium madagascariense]MCV7014329.1 adenylate/guanylate cyclase domain-containing protein [Mycolicibacterium madagascariense]BBZ30644.1 adenylate cyclase [Mycolicibacterium madagascariense]